MGLRYPASSVLILGEEDGRLENSKQFNLWLAEEGKTTGQGFTIKVDNCARLIAGCQMKNKGQGVSSNRATKGFRILGSSNEDGPWETLLEDELADTRGWTAATLTNFTLEEPVEVQFLKFDLVSYWGVGGGLQYFAAVPAAATTIVEVTSKYD